MSLRSFTTYYLTMSFLWCTTELTCPDLLLPTVSLTLMTSSPWSSWPSISLWSLRTMSFLRLTSGGETSTGWRWGEGSDDSPQWSERIIWILPRSQLIKISLNFEYQSKLETRRKSWCRLCENLHQDSSKEVKQFNLEKALLKKQNCKIFEDGKVF